MRDNYFLLSWGTSCQLVSAGGPESSPSCRRHWACALLSCWAGSPGTWLIPGCSIERRWRMESTLEPSPQYLLCLASRGFIYIMCCFPLTVLIQSQHYCTCLRFIMWGALQRSSLPSLVESKLKLCFWPWYLQLPSFSSSQEDREECWRSAGKINTCR